MDNDDKDYYESYFALFSTKGWKQLIEDTEAGINEMKNSLLNGNEDNFYMIKGAVTQAKQLTNFESIMRMTYDRIKEDQDDSL